EPRSRSRAVSEWTIKSLASVIADLIRLELINAICVFHDHLVDVAHNAQTVSFTTCFRRSCSIT
ncbi:MAG: hypothetical protein OSA98_23980, partial [Rubripirellula sp.]|nr:hypothetical protein [Rubripirellula sp.]